MRQREELESVTSYWQNKKNSKSGYHGVDELTWNDLSMDEVFQKLNYTQSTVGSEYLLNQLRDIDPSLEHVSTDEELYQLLEHHQEVREKVLLILSKLGKKDFTNTSSFFDKSRTQQLRFASMYRLLAFIPLASIVFLFFNVKWGLFCLFGSFVINTVVYYRNKSALEFNLHAITYIAAIVHAGNRLTKIQLTAFLPYARGKYDTTLTVLGLEKVPKQATLHLLTETKFIQIENTWDVPIVE